MRILFLLIFLASCSGLKTFIKEYDFKYCIDRQYEWINSSVRKSYCEYYEDREERIWHNHD